MTTTMADLRAATLARSRGACEHCGLPLTATWELHHRLPGGMGGTARDRDRLSNVLAVIPSHHNLHPDSVHANGRRSRTFGWLLSTHTGEDPAEVPVLLWGRRLVLLDDAGGFQEIPGEG
jgi:hypothetical protein